ncbi:MAG: transporter substrate-binding domain-containing protein [Oscillospiraceae bacterium]|nr:transporter substrate-binding domain-containing protein [Oscillospiraceae bacterium]
MIKNRKFSSTALLLSFSAALLCAAAFFITSCRQDGGVAFDINSITSYQQIPNVTQQEIDAIEALKAQRDGFSFGSVTSTEAFMSEDGTPKGFAVLLCDLLTGLFDIPFAHESDAWGRILRDFTDGEIDFAGDLTATPERRQSFFMTNPILERELKAFYVNETFVINDEHDIDGKVVGFLENTITADSIMNAYPYLNLSIVWLENSQQALEYLLDGKIDIFINDENGSWRFSDYPQISSRYVFSLVYTPVSLSTARPELEPIISVVDKYLAAGGIFKLYELYSMGTDEYASYAYIKSLPEAERDYIARLQETGEKIPVAMESANYPISYWDDSYGYQGIAPDILAKISALTGLEFEIVTNKDMAWSQILDMLTDGRASLVTNLIYNEKRKDLFLWHDTPYFTSNYAFISKNDYPDLKLTQVIQATVGVTRDTAFADLYERLFPDSTSVIYFDSSQEHYEAFMRGDTDLMLTSESRIYAFAHYFESPDYKVNLVLPYYTEESYLGINLNETELCAVICKALEYIDTQTIVREWQNRTFDYTRQAAIRQTQSRNTYIAVLIVLLCVISILYVYNRRKNAKIAEQSVLLSAIFQTLPERICLKDAQGRYMKCNASYEHFAGKKEADIMGKTTKDIFPQDQAFWQQMMAMDEIVLTAGTTESMEAWLKASDGTHRLCEIVKMPLKQNGKVTGMLVYTKDITEHREALERLREYTNQEIINYMLTTQSLRIAPWDIDISGGDPLNPNSKPRWSAQMREMLGFSDENDLPNVMTAWTDILHPEDKETTVTAFLAHINDFSGNTPYDCEQRIMTKSGTYRHFRCFGETLRDENGVPLKMAGALEDITEKKELEESVNQKREMIEAVNTAATYLLNTDIESFGQALYQSMGTLALAVRADRMYVWKNHTADGKLYCTQVLEWSEGAEPQQGGEYATDISYDDLAKGIDIILSQGNYFNAIVSTLPDEQKVNLVPQGVLSILLVPIMMKGEFWGFVGFDDCSNERLFSESEQAVLHSASLLYAHAYQRNETLTQLEHALQKANKASRVKTDFLAKMSHEIRTPMNAIIGMTELALRNDDTGRMVEHILPVKQAASNLLSIVNEILDFSKIESGKMTLAPKDYSVAQLIDEVVSIIRMRMTSALVRFTVLADSSIPSALYGDESRVRQAVLNVLINAVKYTREGFVTFGVHSEIVNDETVNIIMEVKDTGIGIKEEDIDELFTDFTQFDLEKNEGVEGVGLGLAITKSIVEAMGGEISVESVYGRGTTIRLSIPQKYHTPATPLAAVEKPKDKKVLLYERREIYAQAFDHSFGGLEVDYTLVKNGVELYEQMEKQDFDYLFITYAVYRKNEETIVKFGKNTKVVILAEYSEVIPERDLSVLTLPVYCTHVACILNDADYKETYYMNEAKQETFAAPDVLILIVDDLRTNLAVAKGLLGPYKIRTELCSGGAAAVEAIKKASGKAADKRYDLVFMDHRMPGVDGIEATSQIRKLGKTNEYCRKLPIIALTANAVLGAKEMFLNSGFNDFLSKPIDTEALHTMLEKWIPKDKQKPL